MTTDLAPAGHPRSAPPRTIDPGRVVVTALFTLSMLSAAGQCRLSLVRFGATPRGLLELASAALTVVFCALVVTAYLRRGPASATDRTVAVWFAAPLATCLPFLVPALPARPGGAVRAAVALVLILAGTAWSVWAVRHLWTCLSVLPQARALVDEGPYRWVRHPLYLGELVAVAGFAVRGGHPAHVALLAALLALQLYRASREERLLADGIPGYRAYAARTRRIVPGLL
jgi:protein-S-isoprenylcysteine O-methyltransferase Ste14